MESEKKVAARDKLVSKACTWLWRRNGKAGLTGPKLERAQSKFRESEHDLADAVVQFEKEK